MMLKNLLRKLTDPFGIEVARRTPYSDIRALMRGLRPVDAGIDLIRLGPAGDGGYLVPDDLAGIRYAFSPGVSDESGFEADLAKLGLQVFLADFSVDSPAEVNAHFAFEKKYVGCLSNETFMTLDEWNQSVIPESDEDMILQMDIEGFEFEALLSTSDRLLSQFRIMVIEFHGLGRLFNEPYFTLASRAFEKLLLTHSVVHIHPNNCCGSRRAKGLEVPNTAEFTFLRNDRLKKRGQIERFPHPLDHDNLPSPNLILHESWYR